MLNNIDISLTIYEGRKRLKIKKIIYKPKELDTYGNSTSNVDIKVYLEKESKA